MRKSSKFTSVFNAKVAMEAIRESATMAELAKCYVGSPGRAFRCCRLETELGTLSATNCHKLMEECMERHGKPEVVNSDQGSQSPPSGEGSC